MKIFGVNLNLDRLFFWHKEAKTKEKEEKVSAVSQIPVPTLEKMEENVKFAMKQKES